jgi:hypothetical protein
LEIAAVADFERQNPGFHLVYQGGHHEVYCNDLVHKYVFGGTCWPDEVRLPSRRPDGPCDCWRYVDAIHD